MKSLLLIVVLVVVGFLVAGVALKWLVGLAWNLLVFAALAALVVWIIRKIFAPRSAPQG